MSTRLVFLLVCLMKGTPHCISGSSNWKIGLTGHENLLILVFVFFLTIGGELFALLEREGVFLEDAARYE